MTNEQLSKANGLHRKITETKKMIADLQNGYMNTIRATSYSGDKEDSSCMTFSRSDELHRLILDYFNNQLVVLQDEFESL